MEGVGKHTVSLRLYVYVMHGFDHHRLPCYYYTVGIFCEGGGGEIEKVGERGILIEFEE